MFRIAALASLALLAACADIDGYAGHGYGSHAYRSAPPPYWGPSYAPAPAPYWGRPAWRHHGGWPGSHVGRAAPSPMPRMAPPPTPIAPPRGGGPVFAPGPNEDPPRTGGANM